MKTSFLCVIGTCTALLAGSAFAEEHGDMHNGMHKAHGDKHQRFFSKVDTNNDGMVSKDEMVAHAEKRFEKMDADNNGQVTQEEAEAYHDAKRDAMRKHRMEKMEQDAMPDNAPGASEMPEAPEMPDAPDASAAPSSEMPALPDVPAPDAVPAQ